jgi:Rod binding domain-containing protein
MSNPLAIAPAAAGLPTTTALPIAGEARAPAAVREGSSAVKQAYARAQGFEEMLLQQLSQSLVQSSGLSGESGAGGEEGSGEEGASLGGESSGMLSSLLPQTLTEGVMRQGGLGLAAQLMDSLDPAAARSTAAASGAGVATGGVAAPASSGTGSPTAVPAVPATTGGTSA